MKTEILVLHLQTKKGQELLTIAEAKRKAKKRKAKNGLSRAFREHMALVTPRFLTLRLQIMRMYFCCFKPSSLCYFAMAVLGN